MLIIIIILIIMVVFTLAQRQGSKGAFKVLIASYTPLESVGIPNRNIGSIQRFFLFTVARGAQPPLHFQEGGLSPSCPHVSAVYVNRNSRVCVCISKYENYVIKVVPEFL